MSCDNLICTWNVDLVGNLAASLESYIKHYAVL